MHLCVRSVPLHAGAAHDRAVTMRRTASAHSARRAASATRVAARSSALPCPNDGAATVQRRLVLATPLAALLAPCIPAAALVATPPAAAAAVAFTEPALLHVVLGVADLEAAALQFCAAFGMSRIRERPGNIFVGFGNESLGKNFVIELYQEDAPPAAGAPGSADPFGGLALAVPNPTKSAAAAAAAAAPRASGGLRCAGDALLGCAALAPEDVPISFLKAGTGLIGPLCRIILNCTDLKATVAFYEQALGMRQLANGRQLGVIDRLSEDPAYPKRALLAYPGATGGAGAALELREVASLKPKSRAFDKIALGVPDLQAAADRVSAYVGPPGTSGRGALVKPPFAVPGIGTRVAIIADPDGHTLALVDGADFEKELVV